MFAFIKQTWEVKRTSGGAWGEQRALKLSLVLGIQEMEDKAPLRGEFIYCVLFVSLEEPLDFEFQASA